MAEDNGQGADSGVSAGRRLRFGEFLLDTASQRLHRREREIPLTPKAFKVLTLLAFHPEQVITKERLLDEIWADVHVLEGVVKVCIADLRKALGETAARPRHLHTVQRRGYRFEGPVTEEAPAQDAPPPTPAAVERPASTRPEATPPRLATGPRGERRQVTLLVCEIDARAELEDALGTEALGQVDGVCQQAFAAIVRSLGGRIAAEGDGPLAACFGFPTSFEDDAGRALRAGLRVIERVPALNQRCQSALSAAGDRALRLRLAVWSGPVELADADDPTPGVLAEALEGARRHAAMAGPDGVVLGDATRRLVAADFALESLGAHEVPGETQPVEIFCARRSPGGRSRLDVADAGKLTPIAGREHELSLVLDRWEVASEGHGQGLLLSGEAGIGKSRLVHALHDCIGEEEHGWLELRASAFHRNSSFHPVIELLRHSFLLTADDAPEEQVARIEAGLRQTDLPVEEALALVANLMALPLPGDLPPLQLSPERQRQRTLELMCAWILSLADRRPCVLIAEDLHWADPSTLEFLGLLIEQSQSVPLLVVMTHRPEFEPAWTSQPHLAVVPLTVLTRKQVDAMVEHVAGGRPVPRSVRDYIAIKADGVPLFVEELTKSVLESDLIEESDLGYERTDPLPALAVPTTLQDSLEARLDRLGPSKELCLLASAIGREFPHALLAEAAGLEEAGLEALLQPLLDAALIYRRGSPPAASYTFKHALIQETAYRSLLATTRRAFHARIAQALETRFPQSLETEPESVARHYEEAGMAAEAIGALARAGRRAAAASANEEAIAHLRHALGLVSALPEEGERRQSETELLMALGVPLVALRGSGTTEVEEVYDRARQLSQELGESDRLAGALDGLVTFYVTQSRLDDATELAAQQLALADRLGEPRVRLGGLYSSALIRYFRGDTPGALAHFEQLDSIFDPALHGELISARGENIGAVSRVWRGWALWMHGDPDRAIAAAQEGVALARKVGHAYSQAYGMAWLAVLHMNRQEVELAIEVADESGRIGEQHGFPIPLSVARLVRLRCLGDELPSDERIRQGEAALAELGTTGTRVAVPQILGGFAEFCLECERPDSAATYLEAAFAVSRDTGQPHWDAELHRIRGELLLVQKLEAADEAEAAFRQAVAVAREQQAKMLELRAASRLADLLRGAERFEAAQADLALVHATFTEGLDTADLRAAAALLEV